ncbi:calpain [Fusarium mundagurra]|uniref:Calpain n=1 Tax=Fusarium mundagurra TaxID=1567541 RepID=A0A8H6DBW7_9HYPO|nr:calpain [Fusarium mundagurra]
MGCYVLNISWVPLFEKAYAKAPSGYASLAGGFIGEAIGGLPGCCCEALDVNEVWDKEISRVSDETLSGASTGLPEHGFNAVKDDSQHAMA